MGLQQVVPRRCDLSRERILSGNPVVSNEAKLILCQRNRLSLFLGLQTRRVRIETGWPVIPNSSHLFYLMIPIESVGAILHLCGEFADWPGVRMTALFFDQECFGNIVAEFRYRKLDIRIVSDRGQVSIYVAPTDTPLWNDALDVLPACPGVDKESVPGSQSVAREKVMYVLDHLHEIAQGLSVERRTTTYRLMLGTARE